MRSTMAAILAFVVAAVPVLAAGTKPVAVDADEARTWTHYLVPLPKQVHIKSKVVVPPARIAVVAADAADPVISQAVTELRESMKQTGKDVPADEAAFTVTLQLGGPQSESLGELKNGDQAYRILSDRSDAGLRLVGLTPRSLYCAAKTLQQLIRAKAASGKVTMPLVEVTDWPDLEDRGLWGSDNFSHLKWMAERKMNIVEQISSIHVDDAGRAHAKLKSGREPMVEEGPRYAIKPVPVVLHLEQIGHNGLFKAYPELKGESEHPGAICYSKPAIIDVLADWIAALGSLPGVTEVDVWMAENMQGKKGCQCADCQKEDRSLLEARTIVAAWKKAQTRVSGLGLRTLTSEETEKSNKRFFPELPSEVKIWYYHSLLTYTTGESQMLRSYLADFARQGRWIGVCPNVVATVGLAQPFTGAHFIHYRMNEFVDKKMSGLLGYATPRVHYALFNTEAAAEWSWNAKGRSPHEFALSWAVRNGIRKPEKFAEWSDTLGPVAWDVYGSDWPAGEQRNTPGKAADRLRKGKLSELGFVLWDVYRHPWGDVKSVEQLEKDVAQAERGVALARELDAPEFIHESLVVQGYIVSLKALWELRQVVSAEGIAESDRKRAEQSFRMYIDGLRQAAEAMPRWEEALPLVKGDHRFAPKTVGIITEMMKEMEGLASELGIDLNRK